jgi:hypothetical protein
MPIQPTLSLVADGANSSVRNALMKQPRFNYSQDFIDSGYKEVHIPAGKTANLNSILMRCTFGRAANSC